MMNNDDELREKIFEKLNGFNPDWDSAYDLVDEIIPMFRQHDAEKVREAIRSKKSLGRSARENFAFDEAINIAMKALGVSGE